MTRILNIVIRDDENKSLDELFNKLQDAIKKDNITYFIEESGLINVSLLNEEYEDIDENDLIDDDDYIEPNWYIEDDK